MRRVTWPNRKQVEGTTAVVIFSRVRLRGIFLRWWIRILSSGVKRVLKFFTEVGAIWKPNENVYFDEQPEDATGARRRRRTSPQSRQPPLRKPASRSCGAAEPAEPAARGYDESSPKKWYIIHTYSGFENKVAESLRTRAEAFGFADKIGQILIPTEEVVELRNGKKVTSKRLVYPGYVLVEMEMNDELWHAVKNTPRVTVSWAAATRRCR